MNMRVSAAADFAHRLNELSDEELLTSTRRLVGASNQIVDPATGQRCREKRLLEFHHDHAHARGGPPTTKNLARRCRAHNALAAEQDFGRDFMLDRSGIRDPRQRGTLST